MLITIGWLITALSIIGAVLNAQKKLSGFYVWLVSNAGWVAYDLYIKNYPQAALFMVYFGISIYGIIIWLKENRNEKK